MTTTTIDEQIYAAEQNRTDALRAQDTESLGRLLTADFTYIHASGRVEERDAYLASIASGAFRWTDFVHNDTVVRPLSDDTALMYGFLHASKHQSGEERTLVFRFVSVWVRDGNGWGLSFLQNAKPVTPSARP